jgi:hypothetical protein
MINDRRKRLPGVPEPDGALLLTLQPGAYTAQVTGVSTTTGIALIEIYDVQKVSRSSVVF